jgi:O-antigen ligase
VTATIAEAVSTVRTEAHALADCVNEPDQRWDLLLMCVAGHIVTSVGRVHQLFPGLESIRPAILTGFLAVVIYLFDPREERRAAHLRVPTTRFLLAFFFWMVLSVPGSLRPGNSFDLVFDFFKTVLMYFIVAGSVRGIRDVERLAFVYLAGAVLYAGVVIVRFDLGQGDAWRLGHLYYYDANDFATFAVTAVPLGVYFCHAGRRTSGRLLVATGLAVLMLGFVRSGSRGGFIALTAVASFVVLRYSGIPLRWRVSALALLTVVLLGTASDQYWEQMGTILSDTDYNRTEESGRLQIWSRGLGYMLRDPIFGVGPNNFGVAEGTLSPFAERQQFGIGVRWNAPHNSFIQAGAELGIPGLVLLVAIIASAFSALRRAGRLERALAESRRITPGLTPALTASLLGFVVGSIFLSLAYSDMLYVLVALAIGLEKATGGPAQPTALVR